MFDGNSTCSICKKELTDKERKNYGKSLIGLSYNFCDRCLGERKDDIRRLLSDARQ